MITSDNSTWKLLETYPKSVLQSWALRCARDVEHLDKTGKSKTCNDLTSRYLAGDKLVSIDDLRKAANAAHAAVHAAAKKDSLKKSADICREYLTDEVIEKYKKLR